MRATGRRRLLVCVHNAGAGGAEHMALMEAARLSARHELVVSIPEGPLREQFARHGTIVRGSATVPLWGASPARWAVCAVRTVVDAVRLAREIRRRRVDAVLTNSAVCVAPVLAARLSRRPVVVHARDQLDSRLSGAVVALHRRLADTIVVIAAPLQRRFTGPGRACVRLIPDGIAIPSAPPPREPRGPLLRLCVAGTLDPVKGQDLAIEVLSRVRAGGVPAALELAGREMDPAYADHLRALADRRGVAAHVRFAGQLPGIDRLLDRSDLLLVPSRQAWTPLSAMEALARCIPVVATDVGATGEIVVDGRTGRLVAPGDVDALARATLDMALDPISAAAMAERGREHVRRSFNVERSLEALEREVDRCAVPGRSRDDSSAPPEAPDTAALTQAAANALRWVTAARIAAEVALLATMVVLARVIPPAEFGRFAVALIVQELALTIPGEGVGSALVQRARVTKDHLRTGTFLVLVSAAALTAVAVLVIPVVVTRAFGARTTELVLLSTPMFLLAALAAVPQAMLRRRLDFRALSAIDIAATLVRALCSLALALAVGLDGEALVIGGLAATATTGLLSILLTGLPLPVPSRRAARELVGFGGPAALAGISWTGFRNGDYAVVGARLGAAQGGFYWRAFQLAVEYQRKASVVMYQVAFPVLCRAEGPEAMNALRSRMVRLLTVVLFPCLTVLAIVAPTLIPWLFGPAWEPAVLPTQILIVAGAATLVIDATGATLMAAGRPRSLLAYGWAQFAVYVGCLAAVAPLGIAAVSAAAAGVQLCFLPVAYRVMAPTHVVGRLRRDLGPAVIGSAALAGTTVPAAFALSAAGAPAVSVLAACAGLAAVTYVLTLRRWFPAAWSDLVALVMKFLPRGAFARRRLAPADTVVAG